MRSGVLTSVHAFATDPRRGMFILAFLVVVIGGSLALFAWRAPKIGLGGKFETVSRESTLLLNNVLLAVGLRRPCCSARCTRCSSMRSGSARSRSGRRTSTRCSCR